VRFHVNALAAFPKRSWAVVGAFLLLGVARALPELPIARASWNTIVVFDITQSMNVEDYELDSAPASRLQFAKRAASRALMRLPCGSRVGWAAFAEYRTLLLLAPVEVCSHYADLLTSLDRIDGRMRWGNASEIAKGLFWALRAAKEEGSQADVIFLTDGHEAPPLQSEDPPVFDDIQPGAIKGWVLGVGGNLPKPIPKTDDDGRPIGFWRADDVIQGTRVGPDGVPAETREHLSSLHESHLRALSREVGIGYRRLSTLDSLLSAIRDPSLARHRPVPTDMAWLPASLALALLVAQFRPAPPGQRFSRRL
jgi:mxaL protein